MRLFDAAEHVPHWTDDEPVFRVTLFDGPIGVNLPDLTPAGYNTTVLDVTEADFVEVFQLATDLAGTTMQFGIALLLFGPEFNESGPGLVWLTGTNLNYDEASDSADRANRRRIAASRARSTDAVARERWKEVRAMVESLSSPEAEGAAD